MYRYLLCCIDTCIATLCIAIHRYITVSSHLYHAQITYKALNFYIMQTPPQHTHSIQTSEQLTQW